MKIIFRLILVLLLTMSLIGCSSNNSGDGGRTGSDSSMTGFVMQIENGRILVIDSKAQDFSSTGGVKEFYNAIWFAKAPEDIKVGDKVKAWYDLVLDSYPGQSEVKRIEVLPSQKPKGVDLTESEALRRVLPSKKVVAVKYIDYDDQTDTWNIQLKDIIGDQIYHEQVPDKK